MSKLLFAAKMPFDIVEGTLWKAAIFLWLRNILSLHMLSACCALLCPAVLCPAVLCPTVLCPVLPCTGLRVCRSFRLLSNGSKLVPVFPHSAGVSKLYCLTHYMHTAASLARIHCLSHGHETSTCSVCQTWTR